MLHKETFIIYIAPFYPLSKFIIDVSVVQPRDKL